MESSVQSVLMLSMSLFCWYSSAYETTQALQSQDQRGLLECAHLLIVASWWLPLNSFVVKSQEGGKKRLLRCLAIKKIILEEA